MKPDLSLDEVISRIVRGEEIPPEILIFYAQNRSSDFGKALHQALTQPEVYDSIPSFRRVRPSISYDEIADLSLFCSHLVAEGTRRNEILFLRYEDIDLENMTLRIYQQKTSKTILLPINKALNKVIGQMKMKEKGFVFQTQSKSRGARYKEQPWHQDFVTHKFKKFIRKAELNEIYTLHSLRHTYATLLREKGISLDVVQKLLGHSSFRTTDENYDHSSAIAFRSQADLVDFEQEEEDSKGDGKS